jgi:hypothetical protein
MSNAQNNPQTSGLTKKQIRNLPHPDDKIINVDIHKGQAPFKVAIHGLLYRKYKNFTN